MSDFDVLGTVGKLALPTFARFQDLRKSELGLVRYGPANRGHRGVFGPFEGSFPIGIPAGPDKFLAIREFLVVHECVFFPMCPGSQINLLRVRKTLCASVATSVGKSRNFQQNLILSACFHARGRRSSRCRIPTILVSSESLRLPTFLTVQALHRGEFGFARYDLANGGRRNVPYAKGGGQFDPVFGLVNGPVKPWSNLVNLGQTWSNLVKALQTLGDVSRTTFQGFLGTDLNAMLLRKSHNPRSLNSHSIIHSDALRTLSAPRLNRHSSSSINTYFLALSFKALLVQPLGLFRYEIIALLQSSFPTSRAKISVPSCLVNTDGRVLVFSASILTSSLSIGLYPEAAWAILLAS
uniref:Uncharacterized protein n=1 Tax=Fagus sylvatica TaxID=28930 RepID=A0A2N9IAJ2_FAGSY